MIDLIRGSKQLNIQQYIPAKPTEKIPLEFTPKKRQDYALIDVNQIVSNVDNPKSKGKSANLVFTKAYMNKISKLFENSFEAISERINAEKDAD